jgi:transcriptional regulator with XRE-family HTH domain
MSLIIPKMERIISLREERGVSQKDLADILGASQAYLSNIETKNRLLKFSLLLRFSEYFEVDINSLITEADFNEFDHNSQVMKEATKFTSDYNRWLDTGIDPDAFKKRQREEEQKRKLERTIILDEDIFKDIRIISGVEVRQIEDQIHKFLLDSIDEYFMKNGGKEELFKKYRRKRFPLSAGLEDK